MADSAAMSCSSSLPGSAPQGRPAFAADRATATYYERRAREYDEWYEGAGLFSARDRPGWSEELDRLIEVIRLLPETVTLDVACGTGFLSRHLRGRVVGLDQSPSMLAIARDRLAGGRVVLGDALSIGLRSAGFGRVFTGHFYGHLPPGERAAFLAEARRLAPELVIVDSAPRPGTPAEDWQERVLNDGSRHRVYKRYLTGPQLAGEIGGEPLFDGRWFVAAGRGGGA